MSINNFSKGTQTAILAAQQAQLALDTSEEPARLRSFYINYKNQTNGYRSAFRQYFERNANEKQLEQWQNL